jgi:hypothetical protein
MKLKLKSSLLIALFLLTLSACKEKTTDKPASEVMSILINNGPWNVSGDFFDPAEYNVWQWNGVDCECLMAKTYDANNTLLKEASLCWAVHTKDSKYYMTVDSGIECPPSAPDEFNYLLVEVIEAKANDVKLRFKIDERTYILSLTPATK